jgi:ubiquinone/menaquinone biosynthesis C-methylase UbiE
VSDIVSIPVEDASFDAILCTEVLEHVPEPIRAIKEFARILKPGGTLFLTAPLGSGIHQDPYHFYGGYTPYWYRKFLTQNNFEGLKIEANGGFF